MKKKNVTRVVARRVQNHEAEGVGLTYNRTRRRRRKNVTQGQFIDRTG